MTNVLGSATSALPSPAQVQSALAGPIPQHGSSLQGLLGRFGITNITGLSQRPQPNPPPNILSQVNPANIGQLASFAQSLTQPQMDYMRGLHQQTSPHLPYDFWHQNVGIPHIVNNFQSFPSGFFSPQQLDSLNSLSGGLTLT